MLPIKIKLPEHFLDEEVRCGYTISSGMKAVWAVELDLLNKFIEVSDKYNLRWFTDSGTTIGAMRHKGYIPWDDDIDVAMFREDYKKLCSIAQKEFKKPYFFQTEQSDPGSLRGHAQIRNTKTTGILKSEESIHYRFNQGIFIDIFVLDFVPDDDEQLHKLIRDVELYRAQAQYTRDLIEIKLRNRKTTNLLKKIYNKVKYTLLHNHFLYPMGYNTRYNEYETLLCQCKDTNRVSNLSLLPYKAHRTRKTEWYSSVIKSPFEFLEVNVPIGFNEILTNMYGDWKTPINACTSHGGVIYDVFNSYKNFNKK